MSGKCCMVGLNIQFKIINQIKFSQEVQDCCRVKIILVFCRLLRFGFYQQSPFKSYFLFIINSHLEKLRQLFLLTLKISIQKCFITLAASPKYIIFASQFHCYIHCIFNLCGSIGKYVGIRIATCPVHISRIGKKVCCTP